MHRHRERCHGRNQQKITGLQRTPHPTTGKCPADLMYGGRRYRTRLPEKKQQPQSKAVKEAQEADKFNKKKQKEYKDKRQYVKPHSLKPGDMALLAQKQTKRDPPPLSFYSGSRTSNHRTA